MSVALCWSSAWRKQRREVGGRGGGPVVMMFPAKTSKHTAEAKTRDAAAKRARCRRESAQAIDSVHKNFCRRALDVMRERRGVGEHPQRRRRKSKITQPECLNMGAGSCMVQCDL